MSTGTTLEQLLLDVAEDVDCLARAALSEHGRATYTARAASLRQRAAWVRELGRNADALMAAHPRAESGAYMALYKSLTGPIPSETAPAKPKPYPAETRHLPSCQSVYPGHCSCGATAGEAKPRECQVQGCGRHVGDCPHGAGTR